MGRLARFTRIRKDERGFFMPTVIILMGLMAIIAYSALMQANNSLNLAYKQTYVTMARVASKAAIDYAQEQFDKSTCGGYTGTTETDLVSNSRYRVTFKVEVISTSTDGYEKSIKGTGSVYLPKLSSTAQYVFDIRSEIVRTYATCKTPDNFAPLVWLDASNIASLKKTGTSTTTASPTTSYGVAGDTTRDTLEERADNGTQTAAAWQSNDFEMSTCDSTEFSASVCSSNTTKYVNIGMVYSNVTVPRGSTITSASITLNCTTPSGTSGALNNRIYGIYKAANNVHPDLFTQAGTNQLKTPLATAGLHTTAFTNVTSNNCPPGNNTVFDVTSVVQEIINNSNWDPATGGGRMGFAIQRTSGAGSRHFLKNSNQLSISYSATTVAQANNNDSLGEWDDISGNNNHAKYAYGTAPVRVDNQINGKTIVRFNNGTLASTLVNALTAKRELTVFAVVKSNFTTSASDGRIVTGMSTTGTNDTTAGNSIIPLLRYATNSGFSNLYYTNAAAYRTDYTCGAACASTPYLFTSLFDVNSTTNKVDSTLKGAGAPVATKTNLSPTGSPYTYSLDQFYYGGRRNGSIAGGTGTDYFNGDFAEIVIYDHALQCREIEQLEDYFRSKWNLSATQYTSTCPADAIPTL